MNLVTDKWIPCTQLNGGEKRASLLDCYTDKSLAGLSVRPHERVALMRLLECIAYASCGVPADYEELQACRECLADKAVSYLTQWKGYFELFGDSYPFLQISELQGLGKSAEDGEGISLAKLNFSFASGHNSTWADHEGMRREPRMVDSRDAALWLITYQNFSTCGKIGRVRWDSETEATSKDAPCVSRSMLHTLIRGECLSDSIFLNMVCAEDLYDYASLDDGTALSTYKKLGVSWIGRPIWELFPKGFADEKAVFNATRTFLGRLVPLSRAIRIQPDGRTMVLGRGLEYPVFGDPKTPFPKEVTASSRIVKTKKEETEVLLHYEPGHSVWRHLAALSVKRNHDKGSIGGCAALSNIDDSSSVELIVSAVSRGQADIQDITESVYKVRVGHGDDSWHQLMESEIQFVEDTNKALKRAILKWRNYEDGSLIEKLKRDRNARDVLTDQSERNFWAQSEKNLGDLLLWLDAYGSEKAPELQEAWRRSVLNNARGVLRNACVKTSSRQMRGYISCLDEFNRGVSKYLGGQKK